MSWIMEEVEILIESIQTAFSEELSKAGAAPFLEIGEARQAAQRTYQWLLKESLQKGKRGTTPNLYDMLSYLIAKGDSLGFSYDTRMEQGGIIVFEIKSKDKINKMIPIFLELLLAHVCEKLGKFDSEITHTQDGTIVAKIKLV